MAVCLLTVDAQAQTPVPPAREVSQGSFVDRAGDKHSWRITETHALLWDGQPYVPAGTAFTPTSLQDGGEAAWQADVQALTALKARGLHDIILWPDRSLPDVSPKAFQRLITYLDDNDFRYGLSFGLGLTAPLTGTVVRPNSYRFIEKNGRTANWQVANADEGLVIQIDMTIDDNKILPNSGVVPIRDNVLSFPLESSGRKVIAFLYPHKRVPVIGENSPPDVWNGFDDYRDRVMAFFTQVKLGKGFRFFLDPLARHLGLADEIDYLIPDSTGFLLEWESFLARRYPNVDDAIKKWTLLEGDFRTHRDLAQIIPLWDKTHGLGYCYDPHSPQHRTYRIRNAEQSTWWADFLECRNESLRYYMNALADVLKQQVANVPVVYTWTHTHPIFLNTDSSGGFDGLGVVTHGTPSTPRVLGPAYSEAEQSSRTIWCLATEMNGVENTVAAPQVTTSALDPSSAGNQRPLPVGYNSRNVLFADLDKCKRIGYKGFFLNSAPSLPNSAGGLPSPESLGWLQEYAAQLAGQPNLIRTAPRILFYPQFAPGPAQVGPIPGVADTLWLNSFYPGETIDWWPSYSGYIIQRGPEAPIETVLVSLQGKRESHFLVTDPKGVQAFTADGTPVPFKISKNEITITLDSTPTILTMKGQRFSDVTVKQPYFVVPREAITDSLVQLDALLADAIRQKVPSVDSAKGNIEHARASLSRLNYDEAYTFARSSLDTLTEMASPYIWLEGERSHPDENTFEEIAPNAEASGGSYLRLSSPHPEPSFGYGAHIEFNVVRPGVYNIWMAASVPGPTISPYVWRVDAPPDAKPLDPLPRGPLYMGDRFGWILLGSKSLAPGSHMIAINLTGPAATHLYTFSIDTFMITPTTFTPNGKVRPLPLDSNTIREIMKEKRREKDSLN
jgi:hypothetical protein